MKGMWARADAPERSERAPRKAPCVKPGGLGFAPLAAGLVPGHAPLSPTDIFAPASTPAQSIFELSVFVWATAAAIFLVVFCLLAYASVRFRKRKDDDGREPAQVYGSTQIELAWTIIPVLVVLVLFLTSARVIFSVQDAVHPAGTLEVTVIGHQFWWEYRYPGLNVVTANELHVPVSDPAAPHAHRPQASLGGHRPQLLGAAPCREDGPHPQLPQHHVD